jgi:hypothetical protein
MDKAGHPVVGDFGLAIPLRTITPEEKTFPIHVTEHQRSF